MEEILYQEDFNDGEAQDWELESRLQDEEFWLVEDGILHGQGHAWATYVEGDWKDFHIHIRLWIERGSTIHLNYRFQDPDKGRGRYFISFHEEGAALMKQYWQPERFVGPLASYDTPHVAGQWHNVEINTQGPRTQFFVDNQLEFDVVDPEEPILQGTIAFETLEGSFARVDDIVVTGTPSSTILPYVLAGCAIVLIGGATIVFRFRQTRKEGLRRVEQEKVKDEEPLTKVLLEIPLSQVIKATKSLQQYHFHLIYPPGFRFEGEIDPETGRQYIQIGVDSRKFPQAEIFWMEKQGYGRIIESNEWVRIQGNPYPNYLQNALELLQTEQITSIYEEGSYWLIELQSKSFSTPDDLQRYFKNIFGEQMDHQLPELITYVFPLSPRIEFKLIITISQENYLITALEITWEAEERLTQIRMSFIPSKIQIPQLPENIPLRSDPEGVISIEDFFNILKNYSAGT